MLRSVVSFGIILSFAWTLMGENDREACRFPSDDHKFVKIGKSCEAKSEEMGCQTKCFMGEIKLLDNDGYIKNMTFLMEKVLQELPNDKFRSVIKEVITTCYADTRTHPDPKKENCTGYEPLAECFIGELLTLCPPY